MATVVPDMLNLVVKLICKTNQIVRGSDLTKIIQPERKLACNHNGLEAAKRALQTEPATMNNGLINPANTANIEEVLFKKISPSLKLLRF